MTRSNAQIEQAKRRAGLPAEDQPVGSVSSNAVRNRNVPEGAHVTKLKGSSSKSSAPVQRGRTEFPSTPVGGKSMPDPPEAPDPRDALGGSSGSSQAGAVTIPTNSGLGRINDAQSKAAAAISELDGLFEERKQALREQYQLEETPEEKANIQHLLDIIEVQREQGTKVIERVYGGAIEDAAARAEETRARGVEAEQRTAETFGDVAEDTADLMASLNEEFGGAMGVGGEALSPVAEGVVADLQRQAASEGAFDRRMFDLTANDIDFLGQAMAPEMGAQVGALQRQAAQTGALSQFEHDQAVQNRIAQERMQHAQGLQQLSSQFDQRRFGLEDQQMSLDAMAAEIQAQNARHNASMRQQAANSLSPQQELDLRQSEMSFEREMEEFERQRQETALRNMGASPSQAQAASVLGAAPGIGSQMLQSQLGMGGDDMQMLLEAMQ